ncbi:MAG: hypothetical protein N2C14_30825 [Planctomycetales bacterium]
MPGDETEREDATRFPAAFPFRSDQVEQNIQGTPSRGSPRAASRRVLEFDAGTD